MKDKELLLEAIDNYDAYTLKQREVLKTLVGISVNEVAIITPTKLLALLNITKPTIYESLKRLKNDGAIMKNGHKYTYRLNPTKLEEIIVGYKKKLEFFENNS